MRTNVEFTEEELLYIEKLADINASIGEERIRKSIETFMLAKCQEELKYSHALGNCIMELVEADNITRTIRKKIEGLRT
jgi:hypothetical protein